MSAVDTQIHDLAIANRILAREGVVDAYGHVAMRHPDRPETYLLSRSRSPELVCRGDIVEYDTEGAAVDGDPRKPYTERFIHGAIFEARPDANAIVHNHAYSMLPFSVTKTPLKPIWHTAVGMGSTIPVWDIRDKFGDTNLLVVNMDQSRDLAAGLGSNSIALMRGHGCVVVGQTLHEAVAVAVFAQLNAMMLLQAHQLGNEITYLSDGEIAEGMKMLRSSVMSMERAWEYFSERADLQGI